MSSSDPPDTSPLNDSCSAKRKESASMNQVTPCKASGLRRFVQAAQLVVQKSSRRACQLFCCPVGSAPRERLARGPGPDAPLSEPRTPPAALTSPPSSTILILNISNSTLIDCVIGPESHAHTHAPAAGSPSLTQRSALHAHDQVRCSCERGRQGAAQASPPVPPRDEPASINIHGSCLNYVIIGDNNNMHVEHVTEAEAPLL